MPSDQDHDAQLSESATRPERPAMATTTSISDHDNDHHHGPGRPASSNSFSVPNDPSDQFDQFDRSISIDDRHAGSPSFEHGSDYGGSPGESQQEFIVY